MWPWRKKDARAQMDADLRARRKRWGILDVPIEKRSPQMQAAVEAATARYAARIQHLLGCCTGPEIEERDILWATDRARRELAAEGVDMPEPEGAGDGA